jgi:hypothetical protein
VTSKLVTKYKERVDLDKPDSTFVQNISQSKWAWLCHWDEREDLPAGRQEFLQSRRFGRDSDLASELEQKYSGSGRKSILA